MNLPIPRTTVAEIARKRNIALDAYAAAYDALAAAHEAEKRAHLAMHAAAPMKKDGRYSYHLAETMSQWNKILQLPERDWYMRTAKRIIDTNCWQEVIKLTDLELLMDKEEKDKLHHQMMEPDPPKRNCYGERHAIAKLDEIKGTMPEFDEATVVATLETMLGQSGLIFQRGLANSFAKLDRRFRSHDGFRIGSRIIFDRVFDSNGQFDYRSAQRDAIYDVERTLMILDGKKPNAVYNSIVGQIEKERSGRFSKHQSVHEADFFRIRIFQNGNAHLWFKRDDLVEKANKLLADWYGEVIGDDSEEAKAEDPFAEQKRTPARYFGFYPTPDEARRKLLHDTIESFDYRHKDNPRAVRVLEPSAGTGNLARPFVDKGATVDCCEIQPHLAQQLRADTGYRHVWNQDFLALQPEVTGMYDYVIMNPPFDRERDIDHVMHAFKFLKPGGIMHAIMSAGTEFRETKKAIAFREFLEKNLVKHWGSPFEDLPPNSFSSVGTNVNTVIVRIAKKAA